MIKLVAFDWKGTLLADTKMVIKATNAARKAFGYPPISALQYKKTFRIPVVDFWLDNGGKKEDMKTEYKYFHPAYEKFSKNSPLRPSSKNLLLWLKKNNIRAVIYSNHIAPEIKRKLEKQKIDRFITHILARIGMEDVVHLHKRNKEAKLHEYIKAHKFKPKEIISVGDTTEEVDIGHSLGLHSVAITGGQNTALDLKKHSPDFLIHNMLELKKIIKKLNRA